MPQIHELDLKLENSDFAKEVWDNLKEIPYGENGKMTGYAGGIIIIVLFAFVLSGFFGLLGVWISYPATELVTFLILRWMIKIEKNKSKS